MNPTNQRDLLSTNAVSEQPYPEVIHNAASQQPYPEVIKTPSEGYRDVHGNYSGYHVTSAAVPVATQDEKPRFHDGHRVPCGLNSVVFTLLIALLTAVIIGAAVGGGLGGSLAHEKTQNKYGHPYTRELAVAVQLTYDLIRVLRAATSSLADFQTNTPPSSVASWTASATSSSTVSTATTSVSNYVVLSPLDISSLALDCPAVDSQSYATIRGQSYTKHCGVVLNGYDIASIIAYTFDDCIEACSSVNHFTGNNTLCTAALFSTDIADGERSQHANCWLKNYAFVYAQNSAGAAVAYLDNDGGSRK